MSHACGVEVKVGPQGAFTALNGRMEEWSRRYSASVGAGASTVGRASPRSAAPGFW